MALPSPNAVDDWSSAIREGAVAFMNGRVRVVHGTTTIPYDPITDTGGTSVPVVVLSERRARIQHISKPTETANSGEWGTKQRYTVQVEPLEGDAEVLKGFDVQVIDGGENPHLVGKTLQVLKAAGSSFLPVVSIDCVVA